MTGESPVELDARLGLLMSAMLDTLEEVFKDEIPDPIGFVIVAVNKRTQQCGYVSNIENVKLLMGLMRETVRRYEESEKAISKH